MLESKMLESKMAGRLAAVLPLLPTVTLTPQDAPGTPGWLRYKWRCAKLKVGKIVAKSFLRRLSLTLL